MCSVRAAVRLQAATAWIIHMGGSNIGTDSEYKTAKAAAASSNEENGLQKVWTTTTRCFKIHTNITHTCTDNTNMYTWTHIQTYSYKQTICIHIHIPRGFPWSVLENLSVRNWKEKKNNKTNVPHRHVRTRTIFFLHRKRIHLYEIFQNIINHWIYKRTYIHTYSYIHK